MSISPIGVTPSVSSAIETNPKPDLDPFRRLPAEPVQLADVLGDLSDTVSPANSEVRLDELMATPAAQELAAQGYSREDVAAFLQSDEGGRYVRLQNFLEWLNTTDASDEEKMAAMRAFTQQPMLLADGSHVLGGTMNDGPPIGADTRSNAQVLADLAEEFNETIGDIATSRWAWAAGIAFEAASFALGGPIRWGLQQAMGRSIEPMMQTLARGGRRIFLP